MRASRLELIKGMPMRFCIVTHKVKKGDGQGRVNYEIAKEIIQRGHHLTLLSSEVAPDLQESCQINWISIPVNRYPTEFIRNLIFTQRSGAWLKLHRSEVDLVKVNGAITTARSDVNAVHFVHNSWLHSPTHISKSRHDWYGFYQWLYTVLNVYWEKQAFKKARTIVAVSQKVAEELQYAGVPPTQIRVIVNGVDLQEFCPGKSSRQNFGLPENVPIALFAGDIRTTRKNLDTVLHALVQVSNLHLAVLGSTDSSPFPQLARSLEVDSRVHFLGYRQDIAEIMQSVNLLVFPSRYEPFGLVVLEAMAVGLPVVTSTTVGAGVLVTPECGLILENPEDINALADALKELIQDNSKMQLMGKAARKIAEQYSWTTMARNYVDLLEDLMNHEELSADPNLPSPSRFIALPSGHTESN
jgi:glycosyltransferase involved in cell wall biosynthesis